MVITSDQNKIVKYLKSLQIKKFRDKEKKYLVEGTRLVEDALGSGVEICGVYGCLELLKDERAKTLWANLQGQYPTIEFTKKIFKEVANTDSPQGILLVCRQQTERDMEIGKEGLFLFCDSIQDPGNMGTIIRTADAAGVKGVILSEGTVDVYNPKVVRSTMGSLFHLPVFKVQEGRRFLFAMQKEGWNVIAADLSGEEAYFKYKYGERTIIVVGNEANGISPEILGIADKIVYIPIVGKAESLNAAVAASIMVYEVVRQRNT